MHQILRSRTWIFFKKSQNRSLDQRKIKFNETMKEYNFSLTLFFSSNMQFIFGIYCVETSGAALRIYRR